MQSFVGQPAHSCFTVFASICGTLTLRLPQADAQSRVVVDGPLVTSRGPGTALEFALTLVELLFGQAKAKEIGEMMLARV